MRYEKTFWQSEACIERVQRSLGFARKCPAGIRLGRRHLKIGRIRDASLQLTGARSLLESTRSTFPWAASFERIMSDVRYPLPLR